MVEAQLESPKIEIKVSRQDSDHLRGFVSENRIWRDEPGFEFNSATGFKMPQDEDHMNPILIAFTSEIIGTSKSIRHIRQKRDGRYFASIVVVEEEHLPHDEQLPGIENYPLETREKLQKMFDEFYVQFAVTRMFKMPHDNEVAKEVGGRVEYVGYEFRLKDTDSVYVDLAIRGDKDAFAILYEDFRDRIRNYIGGILFGAGIGNNRWLGAEDITQEAFIKAFSARKRFMKYENVPVAAWLFKIATNTTRDHFKRGHFRQVSEIPVDSPLTDQKCLMDENLLLELQVVSHLMDGLTTRQQQTLALSALGYKDVETAWLLNMPSVSSSNPKVLRHQGRVRLREMRLNPEERQLGQYYLITLAHRLLISRISRGKVFWQEGQLKVTVLQSLKGLGFRDSQVESALAELPEDFFDRLANIHTVPR